jgi:hypothetical protein
LPIIERLIGYIFEYGTPIVDKFKAAWDVIRSAIERNRESFEEFGQILTTVVFPIVSKIFTFLLDVGAKAASAIIDAFGKIVGAITPVLNFVIDAINLVIRGLNLVRGGSDIQELNKIGSSGGFSGGGFSQLSGLGAGAGAGAGGFSGGGAAGGFTGSGGVGGTGGGGAGGVGGTAGATSLKDLADKLLKVQDQFTDLTFQVATGGISKSAAQRQFDALEAQFRVLEKQGNTLAANPNIVINVSGALDPEGTARAVANQLNSQAARSVTALRDRVN